MSFPSPRKAVMAALVWASLFSGLAQAAPNSELDAIRQEMRPLQQDYERQMRLLEERVRKIDSVQIPIAVPAPKTNLVTAPPGPPPAAPAASDSESRSNAVARAREFAASEYLRTTESREHAAATELSQPVKTSSSLYMLTLAPQVSLGGRLMNKPVVRAFVTYAGWGDEFKDNVGANDYRNETPGLTYGVQMEAWW